MSAIGDKVAVQLGAEWMDGEIVETGMGTVRIGYHGRGGPRVAWFYDLDDEGDAPAKRRGEMMGVPEGEARYHKKPGKAA